jgi:hypothetical protein
MNDEVKTIRSYFIVHRSYFIVSRCASHDTLEAHRVESPES